MATSPDSHRPSALHASTTSQRGQPKTVTSEALLGADGQLIIEHNGQQYRLRRTRHNKLILTL